MLTPRYGGSTDIRENQQKGRKQLYSGQFLGEKLNGSEQLSSGQFLGEREGLIFSIMIKL